MTNKEEWELKKKTYQSRLSENSFKKIDFDKKYNNKPTRFGADKLKTRTLVEERLLELYQYC